MRFRETACQLRRDCGLHGGAPRLPKNFAFREGRGDPGYVPTFPRRNSPPSPAGLTTASPSSSTTPSPFSTPLPSRRSSVEQQASGGSGDNSFQKGTTTTADTPNRIEELSARLVTGPNAWFIALIGTLRPTIPGAAIARFDFMTGAVKSSFSSPRQYSGTAHASLQPRLV